MIHQIFLKCSRNDIVEKTEYNELVKKLKNISITSITSINNISNLVKKLIITQKFVKLKMK